MVLSQFLIVETLLDSRETDYSESVYIQKYWSAMCSLGLVVPLLVSLVMNRSVYGLKRCYFSMLWMAFCGCIFYCTGSYFMQVLYISSILIVGLNIARTGDIEISNELECLYTTGLVLTPFTPALFIGLTFFTLFKISFRVLGIVSHSGNFLSRAGTFLSILALVGAMILYLINLVYPNWAFCIPFAILAIGSHINILLLVLEVLDGTRKIKLI